MDSKELSSILDCFGDQKAIKTPKLNTIWLELIARALNIMLSNSTFWVVISIDYRKLNVVTRKDHFPLSFIDQVLERVSGHYFYCFLEGYSGYFQIEIDVEDQEKAIFTCPFGTYAYRRMPFGLCNVLATFQRCMLSIFSDMVERIMEVDRKSVV